jgi:hypothetical protein
LQITTYPRFKPLKPKPAILQRERTLMIFLLLRRNGTALRTTALASPTKGLS